MQKFRRLIRVTFARFRDFLFLIQAGMLISLGLVVVGAFLIVLADALPLPNFLRQWIAAMATFGAELPSRIIALTLAISLILMWLWQR